MTNNWSHLVGLLFYFILFYLFVCLFVCLFVSVKYLRKVLSDKKEQMGKIRFEGEEIDLDEHADEASELRQIERQVLLALSRDLPNCKIWLLHFSGKVEQILRR